MSVLFVMPDWSVASELWMQRMLESLEPHLAAIATRKPLEARWHGRVPSIDIGDCPPGLWQRVGRKLHIPASILPRRGGETALRKALRDPAVTVVLVHYIEFALRYWTALAETQKPLFVHCHGYDVTWDLRAHENPGRPSLPSDYIDKVKAMAQKVMFIANSQATASKLKLIGITPDRIQVKPLGVPVPAFCPVRTPSPNGMRMLYLGRLVDFKGPDLVIRAFDLACRKGLKGSLTIAGDGPLRVTCELLWAESPYRDRIMILGSVDAVAGDRLRMNADLFTAHNRTGPLSRQEEAYGVSIVEAMASALPVVTGRSGGVEETVVHGETGILLTSGDVEAHAEAFLQLADNPKLRHQMGEAGWCRAKNHFSWEQERDTLRKIMGLEGP